jgi:hypothetical protein
LKLDKLWPFGSGKDPAGRVQFFGSGTSAEKDRSSGNRRYTIVAGKSNGKSGSERETGDLRK